MLYARRHLGFGQKSQRRGFFARENALNSRGALRAGRSKIRSIRTARRHGAVAAERPEPWQDRQALLRIEKPLAVLHMALGLCLTQRERPMFEIHREELNWAGHKLVLETGRIARWRSGFRLYEAAGPGLRSRFPIPGPW